MSFLHSVNNPSGTKLLDTGNALGLLDTAPSTDTLAAAITSTTATSIVLTSGAAVIGGTQLLIGSERVWVSDASAAPTYTVIRGYKGTTAATHLIGATVNVPGKLVYQLLAISQAPNVELFVRKSSTDINYLAVTAAGGHAFMGGGTVVILGDDGPNSTAHIKFPASGSVLILLASGGALAGPPGAPGAPGSSAVPPGAFIIGVVTAEWVVALAS